MFYIFMWSKCKGAVQNFFLEFCFTYYNVIIYLYFFFLFEHKLHFCDLIFSNDFIRFHRIALRTMQFQLNFNIRNSMHSKSKL